VATMSAAQRRAQARSEYNAFLAVCPSRQLLDRVADVWVVLVLCALAGDASREPGAPARPRALRYSELGRIIAGVSEKTLTQTLRSLERDGLVTRTLAPTVPVTASYELTDLGLSLYEVTRAVRGWAQAHMDEVLASRDAAGAAG